LFAPELEKRCITILKWLWRLSVVDSLRQIFILVRLQNIYRIFRIDSGSLSCCTNIAGFGGGMLKLSVYQYDVFDGSFPEI